MRRLALALVLASTLPARAAPSWPDADQHLVQSHNPDCTCRALGRSFEVGETACLATPEGRREARCGMVLNNTSWTFTARPCPEA